MEDRMPINESTELFHAHLEVMVHLLRDELRWRETAAGSPTTVDVGSGRETEEGATNGGTEVSTRERWALTRRAAPGGRVIRFLRNERLRLLERQRSTLEREARLRVMGERLVSQLEADPGLETRDALAVAWFYRSEVEPALRSQGTEASVEGLLQVVGDAHARLLNGVDGFLPEPTRPRHGGFPVAVAVAATRLTRRRNRDATWIDVEPVARRILEVATGRWPRLAGA
jgi:hypothetical protein